ncbi:MAG: hypothetical protein ABIS12_09645 [Bacteroidia bacterium]
MSWFENNGQELKTSKTIDEFNFTLQYKPIPYIILKENGGITPDKKTSAKRELELKGMQYYTFQISSTGTEKNILKTNARFENEYFSRLEYFSSVMQDDLCLIDGNDTLPCLLFHYERNYNLAPYTNFLLGFEEIAGKKLTSDHTLIFNDEVLGCGTIQLSIPKSAIENLPALKEN